MSAGAIVDCREFVDLGRVGTVRVALDDLSAATRDELEPYLRALPLVRVIPRLLRAADRAHLSERLVLDRLALAIVARWPRPAQLFDDLISAALSGASDRSVAVEGGEHALALSLLEVQAQVLADHGRVDCGRACLELAERVASDMAEPLERGIVLCNLAVYERDHGDLDRAASAAEHARELLAEKWPSIAEHAQEIRAYVHAAQAIRDGAQDPPEGLMPFLEAHPDQYRNLLVVLADAALGAGNLVLAQRYSERARAIAAAASQDLEIRLLLAEARIARRSGAYEEASLVLDRIRTSPVRGVVEADLAWEEYFLARDLGRPDTATRLTRLAPGSDQLTYHRGTGALRDGDRETARVCFARLATDAADPHWRATARAMLAQVAESRAEWLRLSYTAIGEFVALGMAIDHATALANLGTMFAAEALAGAADEDPTWAGRLEPEKGPASFNAIATLARSARLVREASRIAHELGATPQLLHWRESEARLTDAAGDSRSALALLEDAIAVADASYLLASDRSTAAALGQQRDDLYERAIDCAVELRMPAKAARLAEQAKARRLYRDRAEVGALDGSAELAQLVEIRRRLSAGVWTTVAERRRVLEATIATLGGLRSLPPVLKPREEEDRFGAGAVACGNCLVDNRIQAMFCSACEQLLPKTASGWLIPPPDVGLATVCYNEALRLIAHGKLTDAADLLRRALEQHSHQDYWFFLGFCLLGMRDPDGALEAFDKVGSDQWSGKLPVWYPPISPSELAEHRKQLRERVDSASVFGQLTVRVEENLDAQQQLR